MVQFPRKLCYALSLMSLVCKYPISHSILYKKILDIKLLFYVRAFEVILNFADISWFLKGYYIIMKVLHYLKYQR